MKSKKIFNKRGCDTLMMDSKTYRKEFEYSSLDKLLQERDRIIEFMHDFENDKLPKKYFERDTSPETVYLLNIDYLREICDLIKIRMQRKEDPKPKVAPFLAIEEVLSKFSEDKQKEFLEDLKAKDKLLYYEFMEWKTQDENPAE